MLQTANLEVAVGDPKSQEDASSSKLSQDGNAQQRNLQTEESESGSDVKGKWRTSLTVAGLVNGIAFWHYLYMREAHMLAEYGGPEHAQATTTVFRYIEI